MTINPYETPEHQRYVEGGGCPHINRAKTWCNGKAGHSEELHHAPYLLPDGKTKQVFWPDDDEWRP